MAPIRKSFAETLGYDPELLAGLSREHRRGLDGLSQAWLVSAGLLAYPVGLSVWLVEHSMLLSGLASLAAFLLVRNLLRLIVACTGTAPEQMLGRDYRPSLLPVAILLGLAALLSQPAQLLFLSDEAGRAVEAHRETLLRAHTQARADLIGGGLEVPALDHFSSRLRECEFVVLRLGLLWKTPESTTLWTAFYLLLVTGPALLARTVWLEAVTGYERARHGASRRLIRALGARADAEVDRALGQFPTYRRLVPLPRLAPLSGQLPIPAQPARDRGAAPRSALPRGRGASS